MLLLNIVRNKIFYTATNFLNELIFSLFAFLINTKNITKCSFREFSGVNVSKSHGVALDHCGCSPTGFTIFSDHFIIFNWNPEVENPTRSFRETNHVLELMQESQIKSKTVMSWS